MALSIEDILVLYGSAGAAQYGMEAINQERHALQCAQLAEAAGSPPSLVAAALLHDLGHLLATVRRPDGSRNDLHEYVAIPFLRGVFPDAVIEPIRLHVDAKRCLCAIDTTYWSTLSPASRRSLEMQGGPFTVEQARDFAARPFAAEALALRRWDDQAKDPAVSTRGWDHYRGILEDASVELLPR